MIASSTCAVQMLLVAFSRGCAARASGAPCAAPGCRWRRFETPMMRPGHLARVLGARGHEGRVRAAEAHRHAEALGVADGHVGPPLARRREQRQREQVGRHHHRARRRAPLDELAVVADAPSVVGYCSSTPRDGSPLNRSDRSGSPTITVDAERLGARLHHRDRLRMAVAAPRSALRPFVPAGDRASSPSPRRRRCPRRAARRWRPAGRSGRSPSSGS
jgi:hypothetical protein